MHFTELSRLICGSYGKVKQKEATAAAAVAAVAAVAPPPNSE